MNKAIVYIYGNLPAYRTDFFELLSKELQVDNIGLHIFYGQITNKITQQATSQKFTTKCFESKFIDLKFLRLSRMCGLLKAVKNIEPSAIVFQFNQTNLSEWLVLFYCIMKKVPYAIWGCNYTRENLVAFLKVIREKIYNFLYTKAKVLIPYGSLYRDFLIYLGISPDKIFVAQNTINVEKIIEQENLLGKKYFSESKSINILYVGALAPQKKIDSSIRAVAYLIMQGYDIKYNIVGSGDEDELLNVLKSYPDIVQHRIIFHGAKYGDELKEYFRESDVYLMPGTGGLGVNEAMAYGLPIISTLGDETVVDLIDGNGRLLNNMGDAHEQIEALIWFLSLSIQERKEMSERSRKIVIMKASLKNMVNCHVIACKKMLL